MLEGAACGSSNELLTLAAAGAGHRTVPPVTANRPSALAATEESSNPHARHLAPSGSPSNANPSIPNGYRPSGLPHLPRRRQPNPTEPLDAR